MAMCVLPVFFFITTKHSTSIEVLARTCSVWIGWSCLELTRNIWRSAERCWEMLTSRHQSSPVVGRCETRDAPGLVGRGPSSRKQGPLCAASFAPLPNHYLFCFSIFHLLLLLRFSESSKCSKDFMARRSTRNLVTPVDEGGENVAEGGATGRHRVRWHRILRGFKAKKLQILRNLKMATSYVSNYNMNDLIENINALFPVKRSMTNSVLQDGRILTPSLKKDFAAVVSVQPLHNLGSVPDVGALLISMVSMKPMNRLLGSQLKRSGSWTCC